LRQAEGHGCDVVTPIDLLLDLLELQAKKLTGQLIPREVLRSAIPRRFLEEE
jgi:hypothetical protein